MMKNINLALNLIKVSNFINFKKLKDQSNSGISMMPVQLKAQLRVSMKIRKWAQKSQEMTNLDASLLLGVSEEHSKDSISIQRKTKTTY
jgi:hypothetical protein